MFRKIRPSEYGKNTYLGSKSYKLLIFLFFNQKNASLKFSNIIKKILENNNKIKIH